MMPKSRMPDMTSVVMTGRRMNSSGTVMAGQRLEAVAQNVFFQGRAALCAAWTTTGRPCPIGKDF
jgi:ABC-type enterochelin transport system permease subunit